MTVPFIGRALGTVDAPDEKSAVAVAREALSHHLWARGVLPLRVLVCCDAVGLGSAGRFRSDI
jgi:hypothetical protein